MIALEHVSKLYKQTTAVNDVTFRVPEGQTMVLLGTSGCGKTTTLRMVNRLVEQSAGTILVNGTDIRRQSPEQLRRGIGYVLQHTGLFPHYTIAQNIAIVPRLLQWRTHTINNRVNELLTKLQLDPATISNKYPHQLSGGQQQRVGLARALAGNAPVLLMDEPFGALDPVTRTGIRREFRNLDELKKKTILMVTHNVQEAFELGDTICLMDKGKIVQQGKPADLLFKPANHFVKSFFNDQRFLLELQSVTLDDIRRYLPSVALNNSEQVNIGTTVYAAMEQLTNHPAENSATGGAHKQLDLPTLLEAFANYKKTAHE